jgi:subtilase family serine protease
MTKKVYPVTLAAYPVSLGAFPVSLSAIPVCQPQSDNFTAQCKSAVRSSLGAIPANVDPTLLPGYGPSHLQTAYGLTGISNSAGAGRTVAIVSAYASANLESDIGVYRTEFGLPPCTVAGGCLTIVAPNGNGHAADAGWAAETSLDAEMVSAICPLCNILVVQAKSAKISDLANAVDTAASYNPVAISNSYSTTEVGAVGYASHWVHPGIAITAGGGDGGYGVSFPASVPSVVAVGGVSLTQNADGSFAAPTVWSGTGSGCSAYFQKPTWQTDTGCLNRTVNDTAALADPNTGVIAYASQNGGWNVYGGTSVASPIVASLYALAGATAGMTDGSGLYTANGIGLMNQVLGSNGTCPVAYLCNGQSGYDGPDGNGMPYGLAAFQNTASTGTFTLSLIGS